MVTDVSNVQVAVTGAVFRGPTTATAPTGTASAPTGLVDLGWISEDGVEIEVPGDGDSTAIKAWQGGATVRTIRTPSEDNPTWHFTMLETKLEVIEAYFGVQVTQTSTEGSFEYTVKNRGHDTYVIDYVDGADLQRDYVPFGIVTDVGAHTLSNGDPVGYEITVSGELDPTKGYNFKRWSTALKSGS